MITDPELYFAKGCGRCDRFDTDDCAAQLWSTGLHRLRDICRSAGLRETAKWGHPCYMYADRNIAIIGAFRADFRLSFFHASLLTDPKGLLEKQGPNSAHADMLRFTSPQQVDAQRADITAYLKEAAGYAAAGTLPAKTDHNTPVPQELTDALTADPTLADAFSALTPGRQRGYCLHIGDAKQSATRTSRIEKCRDRIFAGLGYNERPKG